eukprot:SAG22_NODE_522_length_9503_cov_4.233624_5_plen_157_part_00
MPAPLLLFATAGRAFASRLGLKFGLAGDIVLAVFLGISLGRIGLAVFELLVDRRHEQRKAAAKRSTRQQPRQAASLSRGPGPASSKLRQRSKTQALESADSELDSVLVSSDSELDTALELKSAKRRAAEAKRPWLVAMGSLALAGVVLLACVAVRG